ncbi:MAG: pyridoxamine 5'-phosphate oxidase family protein, partial [Kiloniellales bacterium]|nr:pyridoxamine 5'-phosphate oxidase family protein [Kiloniellales bacterium]
NRMNGTLITSDPDGFSVGVGQSFGNCPQYIQSREVRILDEIERPEAPRPIHKSSSLNPKARTLIKKADTFFIATYYSGGEGEASEGADVSHRGGKPGFVRIEDDRTFVFPDFSGNFHFNTFGNILMNPVAGFLFPDFENGDLLYTTGKAEIIWDGDQLEAFAGAERLLRFKVEEVIFVEGSLPLRFDFQNYSPMLEHTGSWQQAGEIIAAESERNSYLSYDVVDVVSESEEVKSFYLKRSDGKSEADYEPGQFLPIRLDVDGEVLQRTYTISKAPGSDGYRLSIKREADGGRVSNFFHEGVSKGDRLEAMAPRGRFYLDRSSERPLVLISAGVGITPMIAIAEFVRNEGIRTRNFRRTFFIHGARNGRSHAFGRFIRELAAEHDFLSAHFRYSRPDESDRLEHNYDSEGHVDIELLKEVLPFDDYDFYLCGPTSFMAALYEGLQSLGVRDERIHYETFGPATLMKKPMKAAQNLPAEAAAKGPLPVRFEASGLDASWSEESGSLLDLAESIGIETNFACRSGICGTCATKKLRGEVDYLEVPGIDLGEDDVLICSATPRPCGSGEGQAPDCLSLDL